MFSIERLRIRWRLISTSSVLLARQCGFGLSIAFLFLLSSQSVFAGINIILDLDDTVLKEAPVTQKANPLVQSVHYSPGSEFYKRYQARLESKSSDPGKVIHYELHPEAKEMTGYIVVRPGMEKFLKDLTQDPTNKIFVASSNDPARTQAIVQGLRVGGKTLEQWGVRAIPKEVFNHSGEKKSLSAIRKWAEMPIDSKLFAIDDHPEFYTEASSADQVIGITPWDYQNGIVSYLSSSLSGDSSGESSKEIEDANTLKLNQIWSEISKGSAPQLESKAESKAATSSDPDHRPPSAFAIPPRTVDTSKSPSLSSTDEFYSSRPDISRVQARDHISLPSTWRTQREGHLEAVAKLLEMYPDRHIYFLARDGELLYDFAKTVLKDEPEQLNRIHLLNVSRANMNDPNLLGYLAQEGISQENLENGMKVLFVDTGFSGTIPKTISEKFPSQLREKLQTHLMSSANPAHPSSRVFLEHFHKGAADLNPSQLHSSIIEYEHMPRFTYRAATFKGRNGRWEPAGVSGSDADGQVSQEKARKHMEDLKHYALSEEGTARFQKQRTFWRRSRQRLDLGQKSELEAELQSLLNSKAEPQNQAMPKAMVRDLLELVSRNEPSKARLLPTHRALGITEIGIDAAAGSKLQVIEEHPEWAKFLENPATEIPKLVNGTDEEVQTLRNIIDEIDDYEIQEIIVKSLYDAADTHLQKAAQTFESILSNKPEWMDIIRGTFKNRVQKNKIIEQALKSSDPGLVKEAATSLSYYRGAGRLSLFEKALTHEDEEVRKRAAFSLRYWNRSDQKTLQMLVKLLNHSIPKIRREVASLIQVLYPAFQKKEEGDPFKSYVTSECSQPIAEVIRSENIEGILSAITSLSDDSDEAHPIIPVPADDPRVTPKFASLGKMVQVGGVVWSGVAPERMDHEGAQKYCESLGARLPTFEEWRTMGRAMGYEVPGKKYDSNLVPGTSGEWFWSAVHPNYPSVTFFFDGKSGFIGNQFPELRLRVRCIPAAW